MGKVNEALRCRFATRPAVGEGETKSDSRAPKSDPGEARISKIVVFPTVFQCFLNILFLHPRLLENRFWCPKVPPRTPKSPPRAAKIAPRAPKTAPRAALDRPKSGPRRAKSGPRRARSGPRRAKSDPRAAKSSSRAAKSDPRAAKSTPRVPQEGPGGAVLEIFRWF